MPLAFEYLDPDAVMASAEFATVESFLQASRRKVGWHYVVDLAWICRQVMDLPPASRILDAGGGRGPTQFLLAELGFDVVNIDLVLSEPPAAERSRYRTVREVLPSHFDTEYVDHLRRLQPGRGARRVLGVLGASAAYRWLQGSGFHRRMQRWRAQALGPAPPPLGTVQWKVGNLSRIPEIPDAHFDAVVSLSSLEHIPADALSAAWQELKRVVKPGGRWAVTTSASATDSSWFHEPSKGWCFGPRDLEQRFGAVHAGTQSAAEVLEKYRRSDYLRDHLAAFYRESGNNGMPWGVWDPRYVPVGIRPSP